MPAKHLTYFKVENFKKFESLELKDIGQFNLVTGDNNVGKTSLLEALTFNTERRACMAAFHKTLMNRGIELVPKFKYNSAGEKVNIEFPIENWLSFITNVVNRPIIITYCKSNEQQSHVRITNIDKLEILRTPQDILQVKEPETNYTILPPEHSHIKAFSDKRHLQFSYSLSSKLSSGEQTHDVGEVAGIYEHNFHIDISKLVLPILYVDVPSTNELSELYFDIVGNSRRIKAGILDDLKAIILNNLEDIEQRKIGENNELFIALADKDEMLPLSAFGSGLLRIFHLLMEIQKNKSTYLLIDEIDTGIHHSRMKGFLKAVIKAAELNEVQLFMTTHSLECQQQFVEVFEAHDMAHLQKEVRNFTLVEDKQGKVSAVNFNFGQLEHALNTEFETRG